MTGREKFSQTLSNAKSDCIPFLEEGLRDEVLASWAITKNQIHQSLPIDPHIMLMPNIDPLPEPGAWPKNIDEFKSFIFRLNSADPGRFGKEWQDQLTECKNNDIIRILRVHRGFFLTMGVHEWPRFDEVIELLMEDRNFVVHYMKCYGEFAADVMNSALQLTDIDAVYFSEPIGGNDYPLISPADYKNIVLDSYQPLLNVIRKHNVQNIIFLSYSNVRQLLPDLIDSGFNCLWACETNNQQMDYLSIRKEYGRDLKLIGGIDLDVLQSEESIISKEIEEKVIPLIQDGGFIPLADGRVRENVDLQKYLFYRRLLFNVINGGTC